METGFFLLDAPPKVHACAHVLMSKTGGDAGQRPSPRRGDTVQGGDRAVSCRYEDPKCPGHCWYCHPFCTGCSQPSPDAGSVCGVIW